MDAHAFLPPVIQFYRDRHRMPSVQELTTLYGFHSKNAAFKVVTKLVTRGWSPKITRASFSPPSILPPCAS